MTAFLSFGFSRSGGPKARCQFPDIPAGGPHSEPVTCPHHLNRHTAFALGSQVIAGSQGERRKRDRVLTCCPGLWAGAGREGPGGMRTKVREGLVGHGLIW